MARRATWVWDRPSPEALTAWTRDQHIGELFVHVRPELATSPDLRWMRSVSHQAHAAGIRVAALGGDPSWVDRPADAIAWQSSALSTELFDAVHVDIEPWVRGDWEARRTELVAGYLDVHQQLVAATDLPVEADVAFWLHEVEAADGPLDAALMSRVDAVTVMSHRTMAIGPDSITAIAAPALESAAGAGIPCRLAVETNYLGADPVSRKQTFNGLGAAALTRAMAAVDAYESAASSYAGIAVHDHAGWRSL